MKILSSGSFLNLENAESVEALKFTARRLAEHSTGAVKENLNAQQLENLALQLWQKAEYVARETERRRLQQIFVENFTEGFRELKPDLKVSPIENADSLNQSFAQKQGADEETREDNFASSAEQTPEIAEKTDEFLGFVKADDTFGDAPESETGAVAEPQEIIRENIQSESASQILTTQPQTPSTTVSISEQVKEKTEVTAEIAETATPQQAAKNDSAATNQTNKTLAVQVKEPFEFGKCAVSLNLTLLAGSGASKNRKAIISTASHNLPPEIEFCEIADGEDLEQITELLKNKLARFRQSLPVKYIEQLRTAKSKTAKKSEPTKSTTAAAPTQTEKKQPERTEEKVQAANTTAPLPPIGQQNAANEIQGSLF
ncbi:MAG: hypothetical protein WA584_07875 [Pyrinomonadaceae bacterium]